jgi:acyl-CoA thioester hydrolase
MNCHDGLWISMSEHIPPSARSAFQTFVPLDTRWMDNDVYGHVNNVAYYSFFDTAVNRLLVEAGVLDPVANDIVGLVVATSCTYHASIAFPDRIEVGVRVARIGRSSVRYHLAVFRAGAETAAADGAFTHVYVARATQTPVPIPERVRLILEGLSG